MTRYDLMASNRTIQEFRPESKWAYRRRIRRQMRYLEPPFETFFAVLETLFWLIAGGAAVSSPIVCIVLFVRWWLCC